MLSPAAIPHFDAGTDTRLKAAAREPGLVTFVDVGGGRGQAVQALREENPDLPGRFVVQDLEHVLSAYDASELGSEAMAHDFFTAQPIKGARWYHLRSILHDWPDAECGVILGRLHEACKTGFSSLLIHEAVLPEVGVSYDSAMLDFGMLTVGGMERSERQWERLLEGCGFRIGRVVRARVGEQAFIEAEPV